MKLPRIGKTPILSDVWRLLFLCAIVGVVAGLGAIVFNIMLDGARWLLLEYLAGYHPGGPAGEIAMLTEPHTELRRWVLLVMPAAGGLITGLIVFSLAPEAEGHGTDAAIDAYLHKAGKVRARVPVIKAIASAITIGSGGSGGREGPIAQIGSGFGSILATRLHLKPADRRVLLSAGMGAGIGAIFHAPLAGALFAAEVLYKKLDQEFEVIIPTIIASITAYAVFAAKFGWSPLFADPGFTFDNAAQLPLYGVLTVVVAVGAIAYVKAFYGVRDLFVKLTIPNHVKPCIGGLVVGMIGYFLPEALGTGYGFAQKVMFGQVGIAMLFAVAAAKIVTTSFSIGSGGSGGVFGPAVVIGAALGGGTGLVLGHAFPGLHVQAGSFAIVGMAGFFAAAANTPVSTMIMVSEMTGNYNLLVPAMLVCFTAYILCRRYTLYENQVDSRFDATIHMSAMMSAILRGISVQEALARRSPAPLCEVTARTPLRELAEAYGDSTYTNLLLVDDAGDAQAFVSGRELRMLFARGELDELIIASDLAHPLVTITGDDDLLDAVTKMTQTGEDELCVVDPDRPQKVLAVLRRTDVITAYHSAIEQGDTGDDDARDRHDAHPATA